MPSSPTVWIEEGLALKAGTLCRSVRGLSPEDVKIGSHENVSNTYVTSVANRVTTCSTKTHMKTSIKTFCERVVLGWCEADGARSSTLDEESL